jgi:nucleotide-binding universal stress UspA family protein
VLERTLLKHSTVPIWFWNLDDTDGPAIVVASDPDPRDPRRQSLNLEAVDLATDLALRARRTIIIANAWQLDGEDDMRNSGFLRINETEIEAARSELQAERTGRLDGLAARCRQRGVGADMELREGPVDQVMPTVVGERRASVLVAGTMKRAGIAALVRPNTVVSLADGFQGTLAVVSSGRSETESGSGRFSRIAAGTAFA